MLKARNRPGRAITSTVAWMGSGSYGNVVYLLRR